MKPSLREKIKESAKDRPYLFFFSSALLLIILTTAIISSLVWEAFPALSRTGVVEFFFGTQWGNGKYGIWHFFMGTVWMTAVTMCMAVPLSIFTAIYLSEYAHPRSDT